MEEVEPGTAMPGEMCFMGLRRLFACYGASCRYCTDGRQDEVLAWTDLRRPAENDPIKFYRFSISILISDTQALSKTLIFLIILRAVVSF